MNQPEGYLSSLLTAADSTIVAHSEASAALRPSRPIPAGRRLATPAPPEESLVIDERSGLRPAHVVESRLTRMLKEASLPASHLQMRGLLRAR